jgi:hypothetical protein
MALLRNKPAGTKGCVAKELWGHLTNHGTGSALNVSVTFITQKVVKAGEEFSIDAKKLTEFPYDIRLNHVPASPSHIAPGGSARFLRIPTPITADFSGQISSIEGRVAIECQSIYGSPFEIHQVFRAFVERTQEDADVILTFGDELDAEPSQPEQALTQVGDWG